MSLFVNVRIKCGQCGAEAETRLSASVNAASRPALRQEILDGTFQAETCSVCTARLRLPVHLSYLDIDRGQWILAEGIERLAEWRVAEDEARALFERSYGNAAPDAARELGAAFRPRLVMGWPALREALISDDLELEPVALELLKIAMIKTLPEAPIGDANELRLTGGDKTTLHFAWIEGASEEHLAAVSMARTVYEDIIADPLPWAPLRQALEGQLFIDLRRLFLA